MSRSRAVAYHFALSVLIAVAVASLVFLLWFPTSLRDLAGGQKLFWTLVGVDVVCGPLLMWVLFKPHKTKLALGIDVSLIAIIQLIALGYGLFSLLSARPLAFVFEVDRFRVVTYADITEADLRYLPPWAKPWRLEPPRLLGIRMPTSASERFESFEIALQGVEVSQRPQHWQDYALSADEVRVRAKPLTLLRQRQPDKAGIIDQAVSDAMVDFHPGETREADQLLWLPLVSRNTLEWTVFLDPQTLRIRALAPIDGFL